MPRAIVEDNSRLALRVRPDDKATLMRAVVLEHTDMSDFNLAIHNGQHARPAIRPNSSYSPATGYPAASAKSARPPRPPDGATDGRSAD